MLNESEDKASTLAEVVEMFATEQHKDLINEIKEQATKASSDVEYASKLGLRTLSRTEEKFYENFKDIKQAITGASNSMVFLLCMNKKGS